MNMKENNKIHFYSLLTARLINYGLCFSIIMNLYVFFVAVLTLKAYTLLALTAAVLWIVFEALLIKLWGTTLGHWISGIWIKDKKGKKLSFAEAFRWGLKLKSRGKMIKNKFNKYLHILAFMGVVLGISMPIAMFKPIKNTFIPLSFLWESEWITYAPQDARFTAHFPGDPTLESKQLEITKYKKTLSYQQLTAEDKNVTYTLSYMDFPKKWRMLGPKTLLTKILDFMIENEHPGHEVIQKGITQHGKHPAIAFQLKQVDKEIHGKLILVGTTLYRLTVTYPTQLANEFSPNQFLESFELGQPQTG